MRDGSQWNLIKTGENNTDKERASVTKHFLTLNLAKTINSGRSQPHLLLNLHSVPVVREHPSICIQGGCHAMYIVYVGINTHRIYRKEVMCKAIHHSHLQTAGNIIPGTNHSSEQVGQHSTEAGCPHVICAALDGLHNTETFMRLLSCAARACSPE